MSFDFDSIGDGSVGVDSPFSLPSSVGDEDGYEGEDGCKDEDEDWMKWINLDSD